MTKIESVRAREILDSRGYPTVEATVVVAGGASGTGAVPSGASTGTHEALEVRECDRQGYGGKGVRRAVSNVNDVLAPALCGVDAADQAALDARLVGLDGTENKARLGANALLAVSLAAARAAAAAARRPLYRALGGEGATLLPVPLMNVINGGRHATNPLDFQEFMIVPHGAPSFPEAIRQGVEVYHALRRLLDARGLTTAVGDEGGFAPALGSHEEALDLLVEAIGAAGLTPGRDVSLALDPAASELVEDGGYAFRKSSGKRCTPDDLIALYESWCKAYPIVSIEDGLGENDWAGGGGRRGGRSTPGSSRSPRGWARPRATSIRSRGGWRRAGGAASRARGLPARRGAAPPGRSGAGRSPGMRARRPRRDRAPASCRRCG